MSTDADIEKEIQSKGLTAARVTPDSIEAKIKSEFYFTAAQGLIGAVDGGLDPAPKGQDGAHGLLLVTICVLILDNGHRIVGHNGGPVSPDNFDAGIGRKLARQNAVDQIWPLEGYLLRQRLFESPPTPRGSSDLLSD